MFVRLCVATVFLCALSIAPSHAKSYYGMRFPSPECQTPVWHTGPIVFCTRERPQKKIRKDRRHHHPHVKAAHRHWHAARSRVPLPRARPILITVSASLHEDSAAEQDSAVERVWDRIAAELLTRSMSLVSLGGMVRDFVASVVPAGTYVKMKCPDGKPLPVPLRRLLENAGIVFGRPVTVTSAYRSPAHNRRVGGARRSQHMACRAVDYKVAGVAPQRLFDWTKRQPGIRGVGIYRMASIHADTRPGRLVPWDWRGGKRHGRRVRMARI